MRNISELLKNYSLRDGLNKRKITDGEEIISVIAEILRRVVKKTESRWDNLILIPIINYLERRLKKRL